MEQLTTIFAPPASDENGVNCGVRMTKIFLAGQLSLVSVSHIRRKQAPSAGLDMHDKCRQLYKSVTAEI